MRFGGPLDNMIQYPKYRVEILQKGKWKIIKHGLFYEQAKQFAEKMGHTSEWIRQVEEKSDEEKSEEILEQLAVRNTVI